MCGCIFVEALHALLVRNFAPPNACVHFLRLSIRFLGALHARKNIQVGRTCQTLLLRVRIRTGFAMHHFFGPLAMWLKNAPTWLAIQVTMEFLQQQHCLEMCAHGMTPMRSFERLSFREVENRLDRVKEECWSNSAARPAFSKEFSLFSIVSSVCLALSFCVFSFGLWCSAMDGCTNSILHAHGSSCFCLSGRSCATRSRLISP